MWVIIKIGNEIMNKEPLQLFVAFFWHHGSYGDNWFFITNNYIQPSNTENDVIITKTTYFCTNQIKKD